MQTFLPYADFTASAEVLDSRRLGKQRVETYQILRALTFPVYAWKNHPAVRMWRGFVPALVAYGLATCASWERRGYTDTVAASMLEFTGGRRPDEEQLAVRGQLPPWLGMGPLHLSHRSALVRKEPEYYRRFFPEVRDDLPYLWPDPAFPRWPARGRDLELSVALAELGLPAARTGQQEAVQAVLAGRDVLVTMRPGHGGSTTGLLAALAGPGPTLWVSRQAGPAVDRLDEPPLAAPGTGAEPRAADPPAPRPAARAATGPVARAPGPEDLAAMAAEAAAAPDLIFLRPGQLLEPRVLDSVSAAKPMLLVVDGCAELTGPDGAAVAAARAALGSPPLLALTGPADAARRAGTGALLGLRAPARAGGGWDRPGVFLAARVLPTEVARRGALAHAVQLAPGPGLVVAPDRVRSERLAAALVRAGVRAAAVAPGMRPGRVADAIARYRTGRLAALVFPAGAPPQLGRARVHFVHLAGPPDDLAELHRLVGLADRPAPTRSELLLLAGEVGPALEPYVRSAGCRREVLLEPFGEPVTVPCRRCDSCAAAAESQDGLP